MNLILKFNYDQKENNKGQHLSCFQGKLPFNSNQGGTKLKIYILEILDMIPFSMKYTITVRNILNKGVLYISIIIIGLGFKNLVIFAA